MVARTRARDLIIAAPGRYEVWTNPKSGVKTFITKLDGSSGARARQQMSDTTGPRPYVPHNLTAHTWRVETLRFNGVFTPPPGAGNEMRFYNYNLSNWTNWSYAPIPISPDWVNLETKALAVLNPGKPSMDLPVFLFELREFPRMLRDLGKMLYATKPSDASSAYLAYSFGWAPLIGDLLKLLRFEEECAKRVDYLKRLSRKGGSRISRVISNASPANLSSAFTNSFVLSDGKTQLATGSITREDTLKAWVSAQVELIRGFPSDDDMQRAAARAAFGLNVSAASIWEAIPWSWLIDYLVNVGNYLDANRGYIPFRVKDACIMARCESSEKADIQTAPGISFTGGTRKTVAKHRKVIGTPTARLTFQPFLTAHMVAILGSLVTTKALRRQGL